MKKRRVATIERMQVKHFDEGTYRGQISRIGRKPEDKPYMVFSIDGTDIMYIDNVKQFQKLKRLIEECL